MVAWRLAASSFALPSGVRALRFCMIENAVHGGEPISMYGHSGFSLCQAFFLHDLLEKIPDVAVLIWNRDVEREAAAEASPLALRGDSGRAVGLCDDGPRSEESLDDLHVLSDLHHTLEVWLAILD